jgi:PAS domain S-box-containing protein
MRTVVFFRCAVRCSVEWYSAVAGLLAAVALAGWWCGSMTVAALGRDLVPMAHDTAWAMIALSCAVGLRRRWSRGRAAVALAYLVVCGTAAAASLVAGEHFLETEWPLRQWLEPHAGMVGGMVVGRMSPVTAVCFLGTVAALACLLPPWARWRAFRHAAACLATAVSAFALVVTISYALGVPLLYGGPVVPMALPTAVAFAFLCAALLLVAGPDTLPFRVLGLSADEQLSLRPPASMHTVLVPFLLLWVTFAAAGYRYLCHQLESARHATHSELSGIADMKLRQVIDWREERLGDAREIMDGSFVNERVAEFLAHPHGELRRRLAAWLDSIRQHNQAHRALLLDRQLKVHLAFPEDKTEFGPIAAEFAAEALASGRAVFSDLHRSRFYGNIHLDLAFPLRLTGGAETGPADAAAVVVLEVDPDRSLYRDIQRWPHSARTGETLLVRREGDEVLYLNDLRHQEGTALKLRLPAGPESSLIAAQAVHGERGILEGVDYRGVSVLAAVREVPETSWLLLANVDQDEIYAPLRAQARTTALLVLVFLGATALAVALLWRHRDSHWLRKQLVADRENQVILDTADEGILGLDAKGKHVFVNPAAARMLGYEAEELIGKASHAVWHYKRPDGSDYPADECPIYGSIRDGATRRCGQEVFWREDGTAFPVEYSCTPTRHPDGRVAVVLTFRDVTLRKQAEDAAKRENAKLAAMIAGMDQGVIFADANGKIVEVNDYFCRLTGKTRDDLLGQRLEAFHLGPVRDDICRMIQRFREQPGADPYLRQRKLGHLEVLFRVQPIYRDRRYDGVLLNVIDVSELVRARKELEAYTEALASANHALEEFNAVAEAATKAKSQFLANMSHEIRTPMTAILGYTDLLIEEGWGRNNTLGHLHTIKRNGQYLLRLINDILDLSKIDAGKLTLESAACPLREILEDVRTLMQVRADAKQVQLHVEADPDLPQVIRSDGMRLRQVLINLLGNAIKFTKEGGVRLAARFEDGLVQFDVIDTGVGMTAEEAERIFHPFSQADNSTTRQFGGTGLGLTISKRLAQLLGGDVTLVSSQPGVGSHFRFTLPGEIVEAPVVETPTARPGPQAGAVSPSSVPPASPALLPAGCRVLLAEDGEDNQRLIAFLLRKAGAEVTIAENGQLAVEAVEAAEQEGKPFDVILMDVQMPVMDGLQAVAAIRAARYDRPIIALTAHAMPEDRKACTEAGCNDYLTKPIERSVLLAGIQRQLEAKPSAPATEKGPIHEMSDC